MKKIIKPFLRLLVFIMIITIIPWLLHFLITGDYIFDYFEDIDDW